MENTVMNGMAGMDRIFGCAFTFDDLLIVPRHSEVLPASVDVRTRLTRMITLNIPIVSAAMDTVTEANTAITLARLGGIGIIHKNCAPDKQAGEVEKVKKSESGMIMDPISVEPEARLADVLGQMERYHISGVPVVKEGRLVGIVTNRDLRFETDLTKEVRSVMKGKDNLVTAREGITLEESKQLLHDNRIEKLPIVDSQGRLKGLITIKDIEKVRKYPQACKDEHGRLRVGAAIGVGTDSDRRVAKLLEKEVDVLVIDSAHGDTENVGKTLLKFKKKYPEAQIIAGNVATAAGTRYLVDHGADAVKVGVGPGSICTTRVVAGIGVPQMTAVFDCAAEAGKDSGPVPIIADGGIKFSGDITKALAAGAEAVMIGSLLAGTEESPGETIIYQGRTYKVYRGMGSLEAMKEGSSDRYFQNKEAPEKYVPEGIVARVPHRGPLAEVIYQLVGGLKSGMGYLGCSHVRGLLDAKFMVITAAGLKESHVHDVAIIKEAPNYKLGE